MTSTKEEIIKLRAIAKKDSTYCSLLKALRSAEKRLDEAEAGMTIDQRDAMWDFLTYPRRSICVCWKSHVNIPIEKCHRFRGGKLFSQRPRRGYASFRNARHRGVGIGYFRYRIRMELSRQSMDTPVSAKTANHILA